MSDEHIKLKIDGRTISADKGQMLIEVTDKNDIYIPRFCYHKKLTIAASFERVFTFIPSITGVEHAGNGFGAFSTSTKHILQFAAMVNFL
jgi:NADH-quinone oxidoreductase subunit G